LRKSGGRFCAGNELWLARMHRKFESCLSNDRDIPAQVHTEIVEVDARQVIHTTAGDIGVSWHALRWEQTFDPNHKVIPVADKPQGNLADAQHHRIYLFGS